VAAATAATVGADAATAATAVLSTTAGTGVCTLELDVAFFLDLAFAFAFVLPFTAPSMILRGSFMSVK
jgi:hypothetical protein